MCQYAMSLTAVGNLLVTNKQFNRKLGAACYNSGKEDSETRLLARSVEGGFELYDLTG